MRRTTTIAILAAACAALAVAPQMAMGKTPKFSGPVNQPFVPSNTGFPRQVPSIEMKVVFQGKSPKAIADYTMKAEGLYGPCLSSNGCKVLCLDFNGVCDPPQCFGDRVTNTTRGGDYQRVKVKKNRTFSTTYRDLDQFTPQEAAVNYMTVTGKVNKRSVTGTVQFHTFTPAGVDSAGKPKPAETCDSGVLTYTATK